MRNATLFLIGVISLMLLLSSKSNSAYNNDELSESQKNSYRNITKMYCDSLAEFGQNPNFDFDNIVKLFTSEHINIYNDLKDGEESVFLENYLLSIITEHKNSIQFTYDVDFKKLDVHKYSPPSLDGKTRDFVELDIIKNIKSSNIDRRVKNFFYIRMENKKIMGIESGIEGTPLRVFAMATKYYEEKNYEKAIKYFDMGKGEYKGESFFYVASMYIKGELPSSLKMKKKKRIAKGIEYLIKAKLHGYNDATKALDRLGIYSY